MFDEPRRRLVEYHDGHVPLLGRKDEVLPSLTPAHTQFITIIIYRYIMSILVDLE